MELEFTAKQAKAMADAYQHVATHKIMIEKLIRHAAENGLYSCIYSYESKLPMFQLEGWLRSLGYQSYFSHEGTKLHIYWHDSSVTKAKEFSF